MPPLLSPATNLLFAAVGQAPLSSNYPGPLPRAVGPLLPKGQSASTNRKSSLDPQGLLILSTDSFAASSAFSTWSLKIIGGVVGWLVVINSGVLK